MFDNRIAIEERPACQDYEELEAREAEFLDELDLDEVTDMELLIACIAFDLALDECWE